LVVDGVCEPVVIVPRKPGRVGAVGVRWAGRAEVRVLPGRAAREEGRVALGSAVPPVPITWCCNL
jgi:hypothetical protein